MCGCPGVLRPPLARRGPGPSPEGMAEGAGFGVAQEEGDLGQAQIGIPEISDGQILAKLIQNPGKAHPQLTEAPRQGADAHPELLRDRLGLGLSSAKQLRDDRLDPVPQIGRGVHPAGQDLLAVAGQNRVQPFVRRGDRQDKNGFARSSANCAGRQNGLGNRRTSRALRCRGCVRDGT